MDKMNLLQREKMAAKRLKGPLSAMTFKMISRLSHEATTFEPVSNKTSFCDNKNRKGIFEITRNMKKLKEMSRKMVVVYCPLISVKAKPKKCLFAQFGSSQNWSVYFCFILFFARFFLRQFYKP